MTHLRPSTAKKRLATSIDLSSSIKKRKMAKMPPHPAAAEQGKDECACEGE
jgi:hypothetical protein